jgi:anti-sigma28 factor (negative regulator of flagellin synthesis)
MVGIQGIAGVPEPNKPERSANTRDNAKPEAAGEGFSGADTDGVSISNAAQAAAQVVEALKLTSTQSDIRADRVAAAKVAIERGDYKQPDIVEAVAQRINKYL